MFAHDTNNDLNDLADAEILADFLLGRLEHAQAAAKGYDEQNWKARDCGFCERKSEGYKLTNEPRWDEYRKVREYCSCGGCEQSTRSKASKLRYLLVITPAKPFSQYVDACVEEYTCNDKAQKLRAMQHISSQAQCYEVSLGWNAWRHEPLDWRTEACFTTDLWPNS